MKRLHLIIVLMVGLNAVLFAQRQPDLSLAHYWSKTPGNIALIKSKDDIVISGNHAYFLQWRIVNNGATANDTIAISDTVKVKTAYGQTFRVVWGQGGFSDGMSQTDTVFLEPDTNPVLFPVNGQNVSVDSVVTNWCDSVYIVSGDLANPGIDPDLANNVTCDTVLVTYWMTDVPEMFDNNNFLLYPNPSSGELRVKCRFSNESASIEILDALGRSVFVKDLGNELSGLQAFSFQLPVLQEGIYHFRLRTTTRMVSRTLTIVK